MNSKGLESKNDCADETSCNLSGPNRVNFYKIVMRVEAKSHVDVLHQEG
jgi:hypothetical protein